jgi:hypothetical protein
MTTKNRERQPQGQTQIPFGNDNKKNGDDLLAKQELLGAEFFYCIAEFGGFRKFVVEMGRLRAVPAWWQVLRLRSG